MFEDFLSEGEGYAMSCRMPRECLCYDTMFPGSVVLRERCTDRSTVCEVPTHINLEQQLARNLSAVVLVMNDSAAGRAEGTVRASFCALFVSEITHNCSSRDGFQVRKHYSVTSQGNYQRIYGDRRVDPLWDSPNERGNCSN